MVHNFDERVKRQIGRQTLRQTDRRADGKVYARSATAYDNDRLGFFEKK